MSFAVCSAVDCQPETEKVLNATIAVSNNHFAVSKNMNSGSVRGLVLKSTPIQPKDPTDEEVAWNVSVETALSAGGGVTVPVYFVPALSFRQCLFRDALSFP